MSDTPLKARDDDYTASLIARATHVAGGHLMIGHNGFTLYFGKGQTLSGYDSDAMKAAAIAARISDRSGRAALPFAGKDKHMTKREIEARIALTGVKPFYTVRCSSYDGMQDVDVPNARIGNAIVRTLRALAMDRPDLFPPSAARTAAYVLAAGRQA